MVCAVVCGGPVLHTRSFTHIARHSAPLRTFAPPPSPSHPFPPLPIPPPIPFPSPQPPITHSPSAQKRFHARLFAGLAEVADSAVQEGKGGTGSGGGDSDDGEGEDGCGEGILGRAATEGIEGIGDKTGEGEGDAAAAPAIVVEDRLSELKVRKKNPPCGVHVYGIYSYTGDMAMELTQVDVV